MKVRIFLTSLSITFFLFENFRFPFSMEKRLTWGVKYEKLNFRIS